MNNNEILRNINIYKIIKWSMGVLCPKCHSKNAKKVENLPSRFYTHECQECNLEFYIDEDIGKKYNFKKNTPYTKKEAMELFRKIRWENGVFCPHCSSDDTYNKGNRNEIRRYSCNSCGKNFSDTRETIFYKCRPSIEKILFILSNMYNENTTFGEIAEKIEISNIDRVGEIAEKYKDFFENEKEQEENIHSMKEFYLTSYLEDMSNEEDFPLNIVKDHENLFGLILMYDPDILETFHLKKKRII